MISALSKRLLNRFRKQGQISSLGDLIESCQDGSGWDTALLPSHVVKYAAKHTTLGGAAAEAITVSGVLATDIVLVTLEVEGSSPVSIVKAAPTADTITVTFSADPSSDHIVSYVVLRAV